MGGYVSKHRLIAACAACMSHAGILVPEIEEVGFSAVGEANPANPPACAAVNTANAHLCISDFFPCILSPLINPSTKLT